MLYKYLAQERIDVIQNLKIRFTQPASLNDPFEYVKTFISGQAVADVMSLTEDEINELTPDNSRFRRWILTKEFARCSGEASQAFMKGMNKSIGILSLSLAGDNIIMWGHYASSFSGYVIGFDQNHAFFKDHYWLYKPRIVIYKSRQTRYNDLSWAFRTMRFFFEKPREWKYEKEVRCLRWLEQQPISLERHLDQFGNSICLFSIPPDAVVQISVGYKASQELKDAIMDFRNAHSSTLPIYEVGPSPVGYGLYSKLLSGKPHLRKNNLFNRFIEWIEFANPSIIGSTLNFLLENYGKTNRP